MQLASAPSTYDRNLEVYFCYFFIFLNNNGVLDTTCKVVVGRAEASGARLFSGVV